METYHFLQKFHSGWAYLVLLLLAVVVIMSIMGIFSKSTFSVISRKIALFALVFSHVQLLVGLVLWFISPVGKAALSSMKDATLRLTAVEHPLINIIAIVLITIGWSKHKKLTHDQAIFKNFSVFYGLGLLLILSRIPWHLWF